MTLTTDADKRLLARGTTVNLLGLIVRNISPLLVVLLARTFPQDVFGVFVSTQMFVLTASRVVVFGLDRGLTWYLPLNLRMGRPVQHGLAASLWRTHLTALAVVAATALLIGADGLDRLETFDSVSGTFVFICVLTLVPYMSLHCWAAAFEGIRRPEYNLFVNQFLTTSAGPLAALLLYALGAGNIALAVGYFSSHLLGAVVLWVLSRRHFGALPLWPVGEIPRELLSFSVPVGVSQAVANVSLRVDLWMLLLLASPEDAAVYALMMMLTNGVRGIRQGYDPLIIPIVSGMAPDKRSERLPEAFSYAVNTVTSLQLLVAFAIFFFPAEILGLAGKSYAIETQALSILLVGNLINGLLALNGVVIQGLGHSRAHLLFGIFALALNVAFNAALIPRYGLVGAASATALAYLIQCAGMVLYQYRLTGLQLYRPHLAINAAIIVAFAIGTFGFQDDVVALSIAQKLPWLAGVALCLGLLFWAKRRTYSIRA